MPNIKNVMNVMSDDLTPLVSVYIPTKNRIELLKRAIDSVFNQTYKNVELIVADDGSTDGSREFLSKLAESGKLQLVLLPSSMGACVARNLAICASRGEFVTGLDDDDYFLPNRIHSLIEQWNSLAKCEESVAGVFDSIRILFSNGEGRVVGNAREDVSALRMRNQVGSQIFAPRKHFIESGLFDPAMPCWQDWEMWLRMANRYGEFIRNASSTYVCDMNDGVDHISNKPGFMIRHGYKLFLHKANLRSWREKIGPLGALSLYPQINLTGFEVCSLILGGEVKIVVNYFFKKILGMDNYKKIQFSAKSIFRRKSR
jgi:glycosyltransferase involved in cell wall biosynthesis